VQSETSTYDQCCKAVNVYSFEMRPLYTSLPHNRLYRTCVQVPPNERGEEWGSGVRGCERNERVELVCALAEHGAVRCRQE